MFVRKLRGACRETFLRFLEAVSRNDRGRSILARVVRGCVQGEPLILAEDLGPGAVPYSGLGEADGESLHSRNDIIFITGRFRSGTTFLWNVFRSVPGVTAYYEPLNERRWFDPASRGARVDSTHKHVEEYWKEYEGLEELGKHYRLEWIDTNLYMDERFHDPGMRKYIECLVERAPGRPVLQFNRVDFRLPWLRAHFPGAKLVHIYRHPRDQWCSALMGCDCPRDDMPFADFERHDGFYLTSWVRDLKVHLPFLEEGEIAHPYQAFYFIWRLSYLFGRRHADHSIRFEDLVEDPVVVAGRLLAALGIEGYDPRRIREIHAKPELGKWRAYAGDDWFRRHESRCETVLLEHFGRAQPTLQGVRRNPGGPSDGSRDAASGSPAYAGSGSS
jgi:hypothetical protein